MTQIFVVEKYGIVRDVTPFEKTHRRETHHNFEDACPALCFKRFPLQFNKIISSGSRSRPSKFVASFLFISTKNHHDRVEEGSDTLPLLM